MNRTTQTTDHSTIGRSQHPRPASILTAMGIGAGLVLGASVPAQAAEPSAEILDVDSYGGVWIGEGIGLFPPDEEFSVMLDAETFEIPDEVALWVLDTDGKTTLIGEGETESAVYENPGSPDYGKQDVELLPVNLPSSEVSTSDWHAFVAMDPATGELVTWSVFAVQLQDEEPVDFVDSPTDIWPIPDSVPGPEENEPDESESPSAERTTEPTTAPDETAEPEDSENPSPSDEPEASEDPSAENGASEDDSELAETGTTVTVMAVIAAVVLVLGAAVLIGINRRKAGQETGQDS